MYVPSATMAAALAAGNKQRFVAEFENGRFFSNEGISSNSGVKLSSDFVSETDLKIGLCPSASIQFSLINDDFSLDDFEFGKFTAWLGVRITNGTPAPGAHIGYFIENGAQCMYEMAQLGTFNADKPDAVRQKIINITANDQMTLFDVDMPSATDLGLTYPTTLSGLLDAMCTYLSVTPKTLTFTNSDLVVSKAPDAFKDATMREVLGWIAEAAGSIARFNREGLLELAWFSDAETVYDEHNYAELNATWYTVKTIDGLHIRSAEKSAEYTTGTDTNPYLIQDNPFLMPGSGGTASTAGAAILQKLSSMPTFSPVNTELFSNWTLDPGDVMTVMSGETEYTVPVYSTEWNWNGDSKMAVESTGHQEREPLPAMQRRQYGTTRRIREQEERTDGIDSRLVDTENDIGLVVTRTVGGRVVNVAEIVAAINRDGSSSALIHADHIMIEGNTTLDGQLTVNNGMLYVLTALGVGNIESDIVSINNGKVSASTYDVKIGGQIKFIGSQSSWYTVDYSTIASTIKNAAVNNGILTLTQYDNATVSAPDSVASFGTPSVSGSHVSIPYTMLSGTTGSLDFNYAGAGNMTLGGTNGPYTSATQAASALQAAGISSGNISSCFGTAGITSDGYYIFVMTSGTGLKKGYYFRVNTA